MRKFGLAVVALLVGCIAVPVWAGSGKSTVREHPESESYPSVSSHRVGGFLDIEAELSKRRALHQRLVSEMNSAALRSPIQVVVTADDLLKLDEPVQQPAPVRVGLVRTVGERIAFDSLTPAQLSKRAQPISSGVIRVASDGGYVFTTAVTSPGASAMRLHFTDFWVPEAAALYLFTMEGEVFGPYKFRGPHDDGDFWSHTLMGDTVVVQIRHTGAVSRQDLADTWFNLEDVGYLGEKFRKGLYGSDSTDKGFCQYNASCVESAACTNQSAVADARDAVAHMQWVSGAFLNWCSGGLIGDSAGTGTPYFLTANHCISRNKDAKNLENFFQLVSNSCGSQTCDDVFATRSDHPQSLRTFGASVKASGSTSDYTLLELKEAPPAGSTFMGWNSTPVSDGESLYRISHPGGAPQAYSAHDVDKSAGTCQGISHTNWIYSRDIVGATEGGSSGSPVVNANGEVVGQLTGSCGTNLGDTCDADSNATIDGAFAAYFNNVSEFLDPAQCVPTGDPEAGNCTDGVDNDCANGTDCNDSACSSDPACDTGSCGSNQAPCSVNDECCSGNCKRGSCKGN
jgi:V8-like Glu-specific endopeptidase